MKFHIDNLSPNPYGTDILILAVKPGLWKWLGELITYEFLYVQLPGSVALE